MKLTKTTSSWRSFLILGLLVALTGAFSGAISPASATDLPSDFTETPYVSSLINPTTMRFAPDGRLFIAQQAGQLRVVDNDILVETPVISLTVNSAGERGLLGIAFDPNFPADPYIYLYYTVPDPLHNRVSRFTLTGNIADPNSEVPLFNLDPLGVSTHNGGAINFGSDGKLYIAVGENGIGSNSQNFGTVLGKMLRINEDGSIPTDNPFYNSTTGNNRAIWALGLRNPFTFAVQPGTGVMYINDVGSGGSGAGGNGPQEEINLGVAGANYGWNIIEGDSTDPEYTNPLYYYGHDPECSIVGAAFYNPVTATFPEEYLGDYFFADFCGAWIKRYDTVSDTAIPFANTTAAQPVDVGVSPDGDLYYVVRGGSVFKISYSPPVPTNTPTITNTPDPNATPTETPVPAADLVINGGFETVSATSGTLPESWNPVNITKDKRKCDTEDKIFAHSGECAFVFKGITGENARLQQVVSSGDLITGDTLTAHAFVQTKNITPNVSSVIVLIKYPTISKAKLTLLVDQEYAVYTELLDTATLGEAPFKIKLKLVSKSATGKLYLDDVVLLVNEAGRFGLIPLPVSR